MLLQLFNGGLVNRPEHHLTPQNSGVIYTNIDNSTGVISPVKDKTVTGDVVEKYFYNFEGEWVSSVDEREYLEYQRFLYYTEPSSFPKKYNGTDTYRLGIVSPTDAPIIIAGGVGPLTGVYQYATTYYNSSDGTESAPSPFSLELTVVDNNIDISGINVSTDPQVDQVKVYRIGGSRTVFSLVATLPNGDTTYIDSIADEDIPGDILESFNYSEAPDELRYLTESGGVFFGAVGDELRFTPIGLPNAWPATFSIKFPVPITGMGEISNGLLVFTYHTTYIVVGSDPETLIRDIVDAKQGCISNRSIQPLKGSLLWISTDGICISNGGPADVISEDSLGKIELEVEGSALHDSVYYILQTNGRTLSFDLRFAPIYKEFLFDIDNIGSFNDILYGVKDNNLYTMFSSTKLLELHYKSPVFTEGSYVLPKSYNKIQFYCGGIVRVNILIDGVSVLDVELKQGYNEIQVPQYYQRGYSIQFEIIGINDVKEINYSIFSEEVVSQT